ncbi:MAG: hypothetical protein IT168_02590 [Bryobacterales bacterium]|nr:hypothetical protein [Bryobacterales bacterium]
MTFPALKTGAVTQYPLVEVDEFKNVSVRFVDGTSQRFRLQRGGRKRWTVRLDALDELEMAGLEAFVKSQAGSSGEFSFTDPETEVVYANCSFEGDAAAFEWTEINRGQTTIVVRENWS